MWQKFLDKMLGKIDTDTRIQMIREIQHTPAILPKLNFQKKYLADIFLHKMSFTVVGVSKQREILLRSSNGYTINTGIDCIKNMKLGIIANTVLQYCPKGAICEGYDEERDAWEDCSGAILIEKTFWEQLWEDNINIDAMLLIDKKEISDNIEEEITDSYIDDVWSWWWTDWFGSHTGLDAECFLAPKFFDISSAYSEGDIVKGKISERCLGGMIVEFNGFPAKIDTRDYSEDLKNNLSNCIGRVFNFKIKKINVNDFSIELSMHNVTNDKIESNFIPDANSYTDEIENLKKLIEKQNEQINLLKDNLLTAKQKEQALSRSIEQETPVSGNNNDFF